MIFSYALVAFANGMVARYYILFASDIIVLTALDWGMIVSLQFLLAISARTKAKPYLTEQITDELLKIENTPIKPPITQVCKNILAGKVILAFDEYFDRIKNKAPIISLVKSR